MGKQLATRSLAVGVAGVLLILVIGAVFGPNSASQIEARVQAGADSTLASLGLVRWRAKADGQAIDLEGLVSSQADLEKIVAAVKSASGVTTVRTNKVDIAPQASPFVWAARKEDGRVTLEGFAPSRTSAAAIEAAARKLYGADVNNTMKLAFGAPDGVDWDVAAIAGLEALVKLKRGSAHLSDGRLVVSGLTESEADAEAIRLTVIQPKGGVAIISEVLGPPDWIASVERGRITFQGKVASEEARRALERAAGGASRTDDKSYVAPTGDWQARAVVALPYLSRLDHGELSVRGNHFRVSGEGPGSLLGYLKEDMVGVADKFVVDYGLIETPPVIPEIAGIDLKAPGVDNADACQQAFNRVTGADRIEFASNRAALGRSNSAVLDKVVFLARTCSEFRLEIHAHTDDRGLRAANMALSLSRATAVKDYLVDRGLSADRLTALGFGPDRPVTFSNSEAGRTKNRRIEFRVVRGE